MIQTIKKKIEENLKIKLVSLITIMIHQRDLIEQLQQCELSSFEWLEQLRFYKEDNQLEQTYIKIQQADASFNYGLEYFGNSGRLAITPLTDRCYLTLTQAMAY